VSLSDIYPERDIKGVDRELRKSEDATHFATDGPAPRRYDGHTAAARVRVAVFVRSEYSNASSVTVSLNLRRARRTSTAPSVACSSLRLKPGEQLLCCSHALHGWHSLLCGCHSCHSDGWARPHWPSVTCAAACVSDTARRLPAHCETMGVRLNHAARYQRLVTSAPRSDPSTLLMTRLVYQLEPSRRARRTTPVQLRVTPLSGHMGPTIHLVGVGPS